MCKINIELFDKVVDQQKTLENTKELNEEVANKAYTNYMQILESYYETEEAAFDMRMAQLKSNLQYFLMYFPANGT